MSIKVSNSGISGQFNELIPSPAARFAQAYPTSLDGGEVLLASDCRPCAGFLRQAVISGLSDGSIIMHLEEVIKANFIPIFTSGSDSSWKDPEPNKKNSAFLATLVKENIQVSPDKIYSTLDRLEGEFAHKKGLEYGFYVEDGGQWLCIRSSSTVSIIRMMGEGPEIQLEISRLKEFLS